MGLIKGLLCDLDNTLYDYKSAHQPAMEALLLAVSDRHAVSYDDACVAFSAARSEVKKRLHATAASHHRLLYIQRMLEVLKVRPFSHATELYDIYWDTFLQSMVLFDGAIDCLKEISAQMPICLITNLTAHIQYRKIKKLGLEPYVHYLVTSEEVGVEKPNPKIFNVALHKMRLNVNDVLMLGDEYEADVLGALQVGIKPLWFKINNTSSPDISTKCLQISSFKDLLYFVNRENSTGVYHECEY